MFSFEDNESGSPRFMFRVWDKLNKEWVNDFVISPEGQLLCDMGKTLFVPSEFEIMQCTGLTDKRDNYIYEGDYVKAKFAKHTENDLLNSVTEIALVYRAEAGFAIHWPNERIDFYKGFCNLEIIGNIYENPEINIGVLE